jgi:hypothetical protein
MATNPDEALHPASRGGYGVSAIDWETSFRLAVIFGIILTWVRSQETKEQEIIQRSRTKVRRKE